MPLGEKQSHRGGEREEDPRVADLNKKQLVRSRSKHPHSTSNQDSKREKDNKEGNVEVQLEGNRARRQQDKVYIISLKRQKKQWSSRSEPPIKLRLGEFELIDLSPDEMISLDPSQHQRMELKDNSAFYPGQSPERWRVPAEKSQIWVHRHGMASAVVDWGAGAKGHSQA
ncbi:hypothetical protein BY996DRAFT_6445330 [Phakopsora pachyrhizi]|nr:hypothetical protein BY996DRAFT_6445330 [Phakopsora pachyrhizi]